MAIDSDNVRYDAAAKRLYVGFGSGALAAISPGDAKTLGEAKLAGHPESFQLERSGSRVFVNVPTADQIAVIDRGSMKVTATWPVAAAKANYPMALDEGSHRVFIGCRRPANGLVFDTATGNQIALFDIVGDTDDMFYDTPRKRLYVAGGEGYIDVIQDQGGNRFSRIAHTATAPGARTALFVADQTGCTWRFRIEEARRQRFASTKLDDVTVGPTSNRHQDSSFVQPEPERLP